MTVTVAYTKQGLTVFAWLVVGFPLAGCLCSDSFGAEMQLPMTHSRDNHYLVSGSALWLTECKSRSELTTQEVLVVL